MDIFPKGFTYFGYVYLIQCNEFVKIGIANDPKRRVLEMQTGNPYPLKLIKAFPSPVPEADEENLHAILWRYHVRGEWFKLPSETLDLLMCLEHLADVDDKV